MQAQYHPGPSPEVDISATPSEFAAMAGRVAELAAAGSGEAAFPATGSGLAAVVVRVGSGPAVVAAADGVLAVSGGPEAVGLFSRNLPAEPSLLPGYHVHFEYAGREWFVAAGSVPLVLVVGSAGRRTRRCSRPAPQSRGGLLSLVVRQRKRVARDGAAVPALRRAGGPAAHRAEGVRRLPGVRPSVGLRPLWTACCVRRRVGSPRPPGAGLRRLLDVPHAGAGSRPPAG